MHGNMLKVDVCVHGKSVREYQHNGLIWVEGRKSSEFSLKVKNLTDKRILVVGSVDGLSIMDGKEANYDKGGYILDPYENMDIPGWRLNNDEVAHFFFNKKGKAYAAQMGKPMNIGVIGFAVFREKVYPRPAIQSYFCSMDSMPGDARGLDVNYNATLDWSPQQQRPDTECCIEPQSHTTTQGPGAQSRGATRRRVVRAQNLGTGFGERTRHAVRSVPFERASETPDEVLEIRYDDRKGLREAGVDLDQRPQVTDEPNAFPGNKNCQPPPGWNG